MREFFGGSFCSSERELGAGVAEAAVVNSQIQGTNHRVKRLAGGLDADAGQKKTKSRIESGVFGSRNQLGDGAIK